MVDEDVIWANEIFMGKPTDQQASTAAEPSITTPKEVQADRKLNFKPKVVTTSERKIGIAKPKSVSFDEQMKATLTLDDIIGSMPLRRMKMGPIKARRKMATDKKERKRFIISPKLKKELRREFDMPDIFDKARY